MDITNNQLNEHTNMKPIFNQSQNREYTRFDDRQYISVPAAKDDEGLRNTIKEAGAQWDGSRKAWYYNPNACKSPEYLDQFEKLESKNLTKTVYRHIDFGGKENMTPELSANLKACGANFDFDNKTWRVPEVNDRLPDFAAQGKIVPAEDLKKKVYVDVEFKDKDRAVSAGLKYDSIHRSWYGLLGMKEQIPETLGGFKCKTADEVRNSKVLFYSLPNARSDQNFRTQLKQAGATWCPSKQAWSVTVTNEKPVPEILKYFKPLEPSQIKEYKLHQFAIPESSPQVENSKQLRDELFAAGGRFNKDTKTWDIWNEYGKELPKVFQNRNEINKEKTQTIAQSQSSSFNR